MDVHRFFVGWLLVAGLVGVYAQSDDEDSSKKLTTWIAPRSKSRTLDESASAPDPTNEDSSAATDVDPAGSRENSNPGVSPSSMTQEDWDWHFRKGEEVLRTLSDETHKKSANAGWLDPQMQSHHRRISGKSMWDDLYPVSTRDQIEAELAALERAVFDKRESQSITKERVPEEELNQPGPSRLETSEEKANRELLDRQMQAHGKKILNQPKSFSQAFTDFANDPNRDKFASAYEQNNRLWWTPAEKNIILREFKEYIDAKKVPGIKEIKQVINKHELLSDKKVASIKSLIYSHIKKKKHN